MKKKYRKNLSFRRKKTSKTNFISVDICRSGQKEHESGLVSETVTVTFKEDIIGTTLIQSDGYIIIRVSTKDGEIITTRAICENSCSNTVINNTIADIRKRLIATNLFGRNDI